MSGPASRCDCPVRISTSRFPFTCAAKRRSPRRRSLAAANRSPPRRWWPRPRRRRPSFRRVPPMSPSSRKSPSNQCGGRLQLRPPPRPRPLSPTLLRLRKPRISFVPRASVPGPTRCRFPLPPRLRSMHSSTIDSAGFTARSMTPPVRWTGGKWRCSSKRASTPANPRRPGHSSPQFVA